MSSEHEARVERERRFHDERFSGDERTQTAKYYAVDAGSAAFTEALRDLRPGTSALEYGCGTGSHAFELAERGVAVTGIDISAVAIDEAEQEAARRGISDGLRFVQMDAHRLTFGDATFDVVCGSGVLHHLDLDRALPEVARVLNADGVGIFYEPLGTNPVIRLYRRLTPKLRTPDEHPLVPADFERARQWFGSVSTVHYTALALAGAVLGRLPGGRRIVRLLHSADRWLFDHVPGARWLAWVVVIRLSSPRAALAESSSTSSSR